MPPGVLTSEGQGVAPAPPQPQGEPRKTDYRYQYVAGGDWTSYAEYVRSLPHYTDALSRDFPQVYEQMLLDPVVQSNARTIKLAVLADDVSVRPAVDDADDPDYQLAAELADFLTEVYAGLSRGVEDLCYEILDGVFLGSRVAEKMGRIQEGGKHAGLLVWDRINVKPRQNTAFVVDAYGNTVGLLGVIPGRGMPFISGSALDPAALVNLLPREKFLIFTWNPKDNDPRGQPLLRSCYEPWWHKQQALAQWLKFLAQTAVPSLFATTPEGAGSGFVATTDASGNTTQLSPQQQLLDQVLQFQGGSAMAAAFGTEIKIIQSTGEGLVFSRRIDYADRCLSQLISLQTLAISEGKYGTRAQAQVHQDSMGLAVAYTRRCLARALTEDLHRPLIRYNWGEDVARRLCPYASLTATAPQDRDQVLPAYASVGYQLAPEQMAAVDEELGLPVRNAPEEQDTPDTPGGVEPSSLENKPIQEDPGTPAAGAARPTAGFHLSDPTDAPGSQTGEDPS